MSQMVEPIRVAYRYQNVAGTDAHQAEVKLGIVEDTELFQLFRLASLFSLGVTLRYGKNCIQESAEGHAGNGGILFGQKISEGDQKQHCGDQHQANRNFSP